MLALPLFWFRWCFPDLRTLGCDLGLLQTMPGTLEERYGVSYLSLKLRFRSFPSKKKYIPYFARMPHKMQIGSLAAAIGILAMGGFAFVNRFFLRAVLSYRGYMFERKPSLTTKIFFAWMKWNQFLNGTRGPALYSWQLSIPRLPVPKYTAFSILSFFFQKKVESFEDVLFSLG